MNELGSELVVEDEEEEEEVQDGQSQEGESDRETRLRILEVESECITKGWVMWQRSRGGHATTSILRTEPGGWIASAEKSSGTI